jgi:hypothetical protein
MPFAAPANVWLHGRETSTPLTCDRSMVHRSPAVWLHRERRLINGQQRAEDLSAPTLPGLGRGRAGLSLDTAPTPAQRLSGPLSLWRG